MSASERSVVGRGIVYTLFGIVVAYIMVVMVGGILVNLYGKPPADAGIAEMSVRQRAWCTRNLIALRDELEGQVSLELQHPREEGDPLGRWRRWDAGWTDKLARARQSCVLEETSAFTEAYDLLGQVHESYRDAIEQMIQVRTERLRQLATAIQRLRWAR